MLDSTASVKSRTGPLSFVQGALVDLQNDWVRNHAIELSVLIVAAAAAVARADQLSSFALLVIVADCLALW